MTLTRKISDKEINDTENKMAIHLDMAYNTAILLAYDDGIAFLKALKNAEILNGSTYDLQQEDKELNFAKNRGLSPHTVLIPNVRYRTAKMHHLLNMHKNPKDES